jgi:cob(I)alamin adenosyltransferase
MPRIAKVYTRTGDDGTTGLGDGSRVGKGHLRLRVYGDVDELSSALGLALALGLSGPVASEMQRIRHELFNLGADLCFPEEAKTGRALPRVEERHVVALEASMDRWSTELPPLANFVLPGGPPGGAQLHVCRAICRRAERWAAELATTEALGPWVIRYLNRLSDALFVAARYEGLTRGVPETIWNSRA